MKRVIDTERLPIKLWLEDIDENALAQAKNLANLPFAFKHIAIMPDSHLGYGMPIGGVMATKGVIIPNAVGVDIGCGMCAVKTSLETLEIEQLKNFLGFIRKEIPVGFNHHKEKVVWNGFDKAPETPIVQQHLDKARYQLGTLGGGNHFIEVQKGSDGNIWFMVHSGSRNFGLQIAKEYHKKAQALCDTWFSNLPDKELSFLPTETEEAKEYIEAMNYALAFARESRNHMIHNVISIALETFGSFSFDTFIDIHHNYAVMENHYSSNVMVHRKGATSAGTGELGIIPGSQGTKSYIVKGIGNPESFNSCSHGAGRVMGRKQAERELDLKAEQKKLDDQGILHSVRGKRDLDEASGAYKDISVVMENQKDLVNIEVELTPLAVIKG